MAVVSPSPEISQVEYGRSDVSCVTTGVGKSNLAMIFTQNRPEDEYDPTIEGASEFLSLHCGLPDSNGVPLETRLVPKAVCN